MYEKLNEEYYTIVRKPDIPPKVEHWLDNYKNGNDLFNVVNIARDYNNGVRLSMIGDEYISRWIANNPMEFASAWLNGYAPHEKNNFKFL